MRAGDAGDEHADDEVVDGAAHARGSGAVHEEVDVDVGDGMHAWDEHADAQARWNEDVIDDWTRRAESASADATGGKSA